MKNLVTHIFKKDLRRTRPLLVLWGLLLLVDALLVTIGRGADPSSQVLFAIIDRTAPLLQFFLLIVFVPLLILEEPLVGTTAFWLSRPISRSALLRAKALFVLLIFILPPILVQIAVLAGNGITAHDIALAVPELLLRGLAWVVPLVLLAVLVPSFGRYAIVGVAAAVAVGLLQSLGPWLRSLILPRYYGLVSSSQFLTLDRSMTLVLELLAITLLGGVVIYQYCTRYLRGSLIATAISVLLLWTVQMTWSWDFLAVRLPNAVPFDLDKVQLGIATLRTSDIGASSVEHPPDKEFSGELELLGVPHDFILTVEGAHPHLQTKGGEVIPAKSAGESGVIVDPEALEKPVDSPIVNLNSQLRYTTNIGTISAENFGRLLTQSLTLSSDLDLRLSKYVVTARLPVVKGAGFDHGSDHLRLNEILHGPAGVNLVLNERTSNLLFGRTNPYAIVDFYDQRPVLYVLRNKVRNEAVLQKQEWNGYIPESGSSVLINRTVGVAFGSDPDRTEITPDLTPEWLAEAELIRLELVPFGAFSKSLKPETFKLIDASAIKWRRERPDGDVSNVEKIVLPDHASKVEVRAYLRSLQIATQRERFYQAYRNPLMKKLIALGPENLDALIDARGDSRQGIFQICLEDAIDRLARPENKALILDSLAIDPDLITVVIKQGWIADAQPILAREIALRNPHLRSEWVISLASVKDPATYDDLVWNFIHTYDRGRVYEAIRNLPGIDLARAVDAAWKKTRHDPRSADEMLIPAAEFGYSDSLDVAVKLIDKDDDSYGAVEKATKMLRKTTPATGGNAAAVAAWVKAHREKLAFDPQAKKFVLKE